MSTPDDAYRAAELRLHEAAIECAQAVYDKMGLSAIDLLDAVMNYAQAVKMLEASADGGDQ